MNISISKLKDSVKGVLNISTMISEYDTIDESMYHYMDTQNMLSFFQGARKVSDGVSEINGLKTIWFRMKAAQEKDIRQEVIIYNIQLKNNLLVSFICVAQEDKFGDFEEEFTKMVYSFKTLN